MQRSGAPSSQQRTTALLHCVEWPHKLKIAVSIIVEGTLKAISCSVVVTCHVLTI